MARKQKNSAGSEPFHDQLRLALNNYEDAAWLGEESPLAAPYFLGDALQQVADGETAVGRGQTLQNVLKQAADTLWPAGKLPRTRDDLIEIVTEERREQGNKGNGYIYLLLELRYFRSYFRPLDYPKAGHEQDIIEYLGVGRSPYFRHLKSAREILADALLTQLHPTVRLERPFLPPTKLLGRDQLMQTLADRLRNGQTVSLTGMGGMGKTAVAATIAHRWPHESFWFTIRPTVNDDLSSLLFSLGQFLHQQDASRLWLQLVADGGKVDNPNLALAQLRGDLHQLEATPPLICIDEVDLLQQETDTISLSRLRLREFLAGLSQLAPLLLIGQQAILPADGELSLTGLSAEQVAQLLVTANISGSLQEIERLTTYTGGNPRFLHLCMALHDGHQSLTELMRRLPQVPSLRALLARLRERLSPDERGLLAQLAVFRSPAPQDAWPDEAAQTALAALHQRQIVQEDGAGGVGLLPVIRDLVIEDWHWLPTEQREQCHLAAANIRAERGEYTAAAYHFVQAGEGDTAVHIWFPHRQQEIQRGQATAALYLFEQLSPKRLDKDEREALTLLRAELYRLTGQPEEGLAVIQATRWYKASEMAAQAQELKGGFLNALGYPQQAAESLQQGKEIIQRLLRQLVRFRYQQTQHYLQQREMTEAWREAQLVQYEAEHLQGMVREEQGNYDEAYLHYQRALALAKNVHHEAGVAQINRELAVILGRQGRVAEAVPHAEEAVRYFAQIGDRMGQEMVRNALAVAHIQAGQFAEAIAVAEPSLPFFEEAGMPFWTAVTAANLAEAHYELGNLEQAQRMAHKVLQTEETHAYPYAQFTLGLVAQAEGVLATAVSHFTESRNQAQSNDDLYMTAYAWRALGSVLMAQGETTAGQEALAEARRQFKQLGLTAELEKTDRLLA
ncbi:MAG: tetratricopeptide repeat protein [Ardenticatenaceae bacterium]|nr:tetratricopeptide repeat protein [Ardenticatenaceae bacterium]MCB8948740.1 tetratricopeptide repeat protein [Ardenticatenaceae bacterium]